MSKQIEIKRCVDWEKFFEHIDPIWENFQYDKNKEEKIFASWGKSAILGNGMAGCCVYMDNENTIRWELGRNDVEAPIVIKDVDWTPPRLPIGDILINVKGKIIKHYMRLSIWNATLYQTIETDKGIVKLKSYIPSEYDAVVIEVTTTDSENPSVSFRPRHGISTRIGAIGTPEVNENDIAPLPELFVIDNIDVSIQKYINDNHERQGQTSVSLLRSGSQNDFTVFCSVKFSKNDETSFNSALKEVKSIEQKDIRLIWERHCAFWNSFFKKSFFSFTDTYWENFYWIQLYKIASATRGNYSEVIDNQGPWLPKSFWPGTWWNLNVQLSYSSLAKANHTETAMSLLNAIEKNRENLRKNAEPIGVYDGLYVGRCTGRKMISPIYSREVIYNKNYEPWSFELGNLLWVCHTLWRICLSTNDKRIITRVYNILEDAVNVPIALLSKDDKGIYHLPRTTSPEYPKTRKAGPGQTSYPAEDTTYDLSLLYWGCKTLLKYADMCNADKNSCGIWKDVIENLMPISSDDNGWKIARDVSLLHEHRHYSHLFPLYPLQLVDLKDKEQYDISKRTLEYWRYNSDGSLRTGDVAAYSHTGAAAMYALLGMGNDGIEALDCVKSHFMPNTMYAESGGPVIESPLSVNESLYQFVMQCGDFGIKVFPAVPERWENICFDRLLAEGGFEISARRLDGVNLFVFIHSLSNSNLRLEHNLGDDIKVLSSRDDLKYSIKEGVIVAYTNVNDDILLISSSAESDALQIVPAEPDKKYCNIFSDKYSN